MSIGKYAIRLVRAWRNYAPGQEIDPGRGVADVLVRRRLAVWLDPPAMTVAETQAKKRRMK